MKKTTLLFLMAIFCTAGLFAQKSPVMATVDVQRVLNDYNAFQAAVETIKTSVAPVEEEMKRMQASIQEIVSVGRELEADVGNPSLAEERKSEVKAELLELQAQLQAAQIEMQQFRQQAQQLAQQGQQEYLAPLQQKAIEAVKQVALDKEIDIVLPLNAVVFSADELEITDSVIAVLNASE
ncbi:MAG: Skp family chaperone for outer membrane protein [Lentimonas sp.]|jgi:Skp family chaperone for outer membrane proteins